MLRRGYQPGFAAGTIAAGGTLKSLIPPSLLMILYCIVAKTFIFDLFLAAAVPAALTVVLNLAAIWIVVRRNPRAAPVSERIPWRERLLAARRMVPAAILMLTVFVLRRGLNWRGLMQALQATAGTTVLLDMILIGASVFTYFITLARVPETLINAVDGMHLPPVAIIVILLIAYIILGTIFEELSAILITLPFVLPIVMHAGYDPVWWGVINVILAELALIHPPFGIIVFVLHDLAPDIKMSTIYLGVVPFIVADLVVLALLTAFPDLALWLPRVMGG
jgi:C4-dicarboxylate transporter, DctM subunit